MIKQCIFCKKDYEITSKRGRSLKKSKYCSPKCHNDYWLKVGNKSGKFLGNKFALGKQIKLTQTLSDLQRQFVIGTLLGDASIDLTKKGSPQLKFQHTEANLDYVLLKSEIMKNFIVREKPTFCKGRTSTYDGRILHSNPSYVNSTVTHQDLEEFNNLFYIPKNGKRLKIFRDELSDMITPFSLLFWYMDDGTIGEGGKFHTVFINLFTNNFSYKENLKIQKMFTEKFGLNPSVYLNKKQNRYYIRFNKPDVLKLMPIFQSLKEYIPNSMSYKFTFLNQP